MNATNVIYPATGQCARDMQASAIEPRDVPVLQGGGNLNGSQAIHFLGQAGTAAQRIALPRRLMNFTPNYCGVV